MLLAAPAGRLADRVGRGRVMLGGYVPPARRLRDRCCGRPSGTPALFVVLFLLGAYYAATDGVLMAFGSAHVPPRRCAAAACRCSARP